MSTNTGSDPHHTRVRRARPLTSRNTRPTRVSCHVRDQQMREPHTCVAPTRSHTKHQTRDMRQTQTHDTRHERKRHTLHAPHTANHTRHTSFCNHWPRSMAQSNAERCTYQSDARIIHHGERAGCGSGCAGEGGSWCAGRGVEGDLRASSRGRAKGRQFMAQG